MRKALSTTVMAATFIAGLSIAGASPVAAEERSCRGTLGAVTVDNLRVPEGARCVLNGTRVKGTITVQEDATLIARNVRVVGSVQAEGARDVRVLAGSRINGSVEVKQGDAALVANSVVGADIQYDEQSSRVTVIGTTVGGNIQIVKNEGGVTVRGNVVDGNLECKENAPAPVGGRNVVDGSKVDQCARL
jgi:lipopolysaccharide assembly outer membrane protein LptD (OstA)